MMRKFSVAILASLTAARGSRDHRSHRIDKHIEIGDHFQLIAEEGQEELKFIQWASKSGRSYSSLE